MTTEIDVLKLARSYIDTPRHWIKGSYAQTLTGRTIGPCQPLAACFCSVGAILRAANELRTLPIAGLETIGGFIPTNQTLHWFNDDPATTHADVLALFDKAIAHA